MFVLMEIFIEDAAPIGVYDNADAAEEALKAVAATPSRYREYDIVELPLNEMPYATTKAAE